VVVGLVSVLSNGRNQQGDSHETATLKPFS
jgi:hypothetical protein